MPTSITVVATSTSVSPAAKRAIAAAFSAEGICPWRTPTSKPRSSPAASRAASTSAALPCCFSDSATSGQTTKAWRPSRSCGADQLEGGVAVALADQPRLDRAAPRRQLAQRGRVEVAVGGQRERAGDRRRGHVEDVREPFPAAPWRRAPAAARPRSGAARRRRRRRAGRTRPRARSARGSHDQSQLAAGQLVQGLLAGRGRGRAGQQRKGDQLRPEQPAERRPRAARPGSRWAPSARPGGPLRAPAASRRGRPPSSPTRPRPSATEPSARRSRGRRRSRRSRELARGRLERQRLDPAPDELPRPAQPRRRLRRAMRPLAAGQDRLVEEQLFELESLARLPRRRPRSRESGPPDRVGDPRQPASRPHLGRQRLDHVRRQPDRLLDPLPDLLGFELLGRRMDRDQLAPPAGAAAPSPPSGPSGPAARSSYSETRKPRLSREPVSSKLEPGISFCAIQGWLNQVARSEPESSPTLTEVIGGRVGGTGAGCCRGPRRGSSRCRPAPARRAATTVRSRWLCGKRMSRSPSVEIPASAAASASFGPTPESEVRETSRTLGRGQWTGASRSSVSVSSRRRQSRARAAY